MSQGAEEVYIGFRNTVYPRFSKGKANTIGKTLQTSSSISEHLQLPITYLYIYEDKILWPKKVSNNFEKSYGV